MRAGGRVGGPQRWAAAGGARRWLPPSRSACRACCAAARSCAGVVSDSATVPVGRRPPEPSWSSSARRDRRGRAGTHCRDIVMLGERLHGAEWYLHAGAARLDVPSSVANAIASPIEASSRNSESGSRKTTLRVPEAKLAERRPARGCGGGPDQSAPPPCSRGAAPAPLLDGASSGGCRVCGRRVVCHVSLDSDLRRGSGVRGDRANSHPSPRRRKAVRRSAEATAAGVTSGEWKCKAFTKTTHQMPLQQFLHNAPREPPPRTTFTKTTHQPNP